MKSAPGKLAVISCLFDPWPHPRRARHFERFSAQFDGDLFFAECRFSTDVAPLLLGKEGLRYRGSENHRLWQKEHLLNNLIASLPKDFTAVAWVDADILFTEKRWRERTLEALEQYAVVQLFDTVVHLDANDTPRLQYSGVVAASNGNIGMALRRREGASGFAWAARREVLDAVGLLDRMILGGADTFMAGGFSGEPLLSLAALLTPRHAAFVRDWNAKAYAATVGTVGYVSGTIEHLYHGDLATRAYLQRYKILRRAQFDPFLDVRLDTCGLLAWSSPKSALHDEAARYFRRRAELENE